MSRFVSTENDVKLSNDNSQGQSMDAETMLLTMLEIAERTDGDPKARKAAFDELLKQAESEGVGRSLFLTHVKRGFTGRREDKLGRDRCYSDGKLVPCNNNESNKPSEPSPKQEPVKENTTRIESSSGPSKPDQREDVSPPSLKDKIKPPYPMKSNKAPKNADGRPITGYTASGLTNTSFGDMVESFTKQLGFRSILPEGRRSNRDVATEGSSIDVEYDHSGWAMEIKAVCVEASEYKAKPKKDEMEGKRKFAEMHQLKPAMMIIVTDVMNGKAWAYWRPNIGAFALNPNNLTDWNYAGEITFQAPEVKA